MSDALPPPAGDGIDPGAPADDAWSIPLDIVPAAPVPPANRPRGRGLTLLVAAGVAAVVGGGAAIGWAAFNGNSGDQPEKHLPSTAGAMVKVDLDPSGGQKLDALRFLRKFPAGSGLQETDDPRKIVYEKFVEGNRSAPAWSEVEGWLGERMALAALPGDGGSPATPVAVLQVSDETKAKAVLAKAAAGTGTAFAVAGGWATISDTQAHVDAVTRGAAAKSLADDDAFRQDVGALGDPGVFAGWADLSRFPALGTGGAAAFSPGSLAGLAPGLAQGDVLKQRFAALARFTGGDAEIVLRTFGSAAPSMPSGAGQAVAELPAGTVAAIGVSGAGDLAGKARSDPGQTGQAGQALSLALAGLSDRTGLQVPQDLQALLGRRFALALGEPDGSGQPVLGVRATSDDPGLGAALDRLLRFTDASGVPLERRDVDGGYVLATNRAQAEAMTHSGDLGSTDTFRAAVPDADPASAVAYVDVERLLATYAKDVDTDTAANLRPLRALGLAVTPTRDGITATIRITTR